MSVFKTYKNLLTGKTSNFIPSTHARFPDLVHEGKTYKRQGWVLSEDKAVSPETEKVVKEVKRGPSKKASK